MHVDYPFPVVSMRNFVRETAFDEDIAHPCITYPSTYLARKHRKNKNDMECFSELAKHKITQPLFSSRSQIPEMASLK